MRDAVDVIGLPDEATDALASDVIDAIDDPAHAPPDMPLIPLGRDRALQLGEALESVALHGHRDVVLEQRAARAFLRRIRERADALEANFFEKIAELREVALGLAGEADDARRADRDFGNGVAQSRDALADRVGALGAAHAREHGVGAVLNRHVEIREHARLARHEAQQLGRDPRGIQIEQPDPRDRRAGE